MRYNSLKIGCLNMCSTFEYILQVSNPLVWYLHVLEVFYKIKRGVLIMARGKIVEHGIQYECIGTFHYRSAAKRFAQWVEDSGHATMVKKGLGWYKVYSSTRIVKKPSIRAYVRSQRVFSGGIAR